MVLICCRRRGQSNAVCCKDLRGSSQRRGVCCEHVSCKGEACKHCMRHANTAEHILGCCLNTTWREEESKDEDAARSKSRSSATKSNRRPATSQPNHHLQVKRSSGSRTKGHSTCTAGTNEWMQAVKGRPERSQGANCSLGLKDTRMPSSMPVQPQCSMDGRQMTGHQRKCTS